MFKDSRLLGLQLVDLNAIKSASDLKLGETIPT